MVHGMRIRNTLASEPVCDFPVGNHLRAGLLCESNGIGDVVGVTVGDQNHIGLDFCDVHPGRKRVWRDERIKQKARSARLDQKARVSEISEFHSTHNKPQRPEPSKSLERCEIGAPPFLADECGAKSIAGYRGKLVLGESKMGGEEEILVLEAVAETDGVVGAERAGNAGIEKLANGMQLGRRDDAELHIADRADIQRDPPLAQEVDHRVVLDGANAVFDALRSELFHNMANEIRSAEFAGMSFSELSGIPRAAPVGFCPLTEWSRLHTVKVDTVEVWPTESLLQDGCHFLGVTLMVDTKEYSHFESSWHRTANGIADLASIEIHKVDATRGKADFHVADMTGQTILKNRPRAVVVALCGGEEIPCVTEEFGLEMGKVAKTEVRRP